MKPKTKFLKMFFNLPERARKELVFNAYEINPMTLNVICIEVRNKTKRGELCLRALGYIDDTLLVNSAQENKNAN